jgi:uncharacterized LabA/DUF88 family protein
MEQLSNNKFLVIVDGSNFYHRLREVFGISKSVRDFDFNGFAEWLARSGRIIMKKYYAGIVRAAALDAKAQELRKSQQRLFAFLRSGGWLIESGFLLQSDGVYHEKGVDVHMAVDLLAGAYEDVYDTAVLVSSDTDLIPAILKARQKGKVLKYIGFSHKPSLALIKHASESILLSKSDMERFLPR